ncbi:MAG: protein-L-isoaspartate(D-aspartate) O-methyltransferase [Candidatus Poribacteria bacterium]|nr:protein-L-isoaspartate(D-aspartate) O-methyltransferase [Candidatus Poribacteria bacterium]MDP6995316.1 protein-L-isoaspartate(D-aspartate) O-methyltransferase [Candidatus Poribacteria bacterium]
MKRDSKPTPQFRIKATLQNFFSPSTLELLKSSHHSHQDHFQKPRQQMVQRQIYNRGIRSKSVLTAMQRVPRHLFMLPEYRSEAYNDQAYPIGFEQTISQPYIVALMTELLDLQPESRVLEIGTGCGYQTAVLAEIVEQVYTVEIIDNLAQQAWKRLTDLNYQNIERKVGNGYSGWEHQAPFDRIIVTAAPPTLPDRLIDQLEIGGKIVLPIGKTKQDLLQITKLERKLVKKSYGGVRFVPMTQYQQ